MFAIHYVNYMRYRGCAACDKEDDCFAVLLARTKLASEFQYEYADANEGGTALIRPSVLMHRRVFHLEDIEFIYRR